MTYIHFNVFEIVLQQQQQQQANCYQIYFFSFLPIISFHFMNSIVQQSFFSLDEFEIL